MTITAGQDSRSTSYSKSKSGLFGGGKGWADIWHRKTLAEGQDRITNISSSLSAGGDLTVVAPQDIARSEGSSAWIGDSATIGLGGSPSSASVSVGGGRSQSDKAWVSEQTGLYSQGQLNIRTENHMQIDGAVIASNA